MADVKRAKAAGGGGAGGAGGAGTADGETAGKLKAVSGSEDKTVETFFAGLVEEACVVVSPRTRWRREGD